MIQSSRLAGVLIALALAASGCQGADALRDAAPAVPVPTYGDLPDAVDYVALGDSFTAGPFIGTMRSDPQGCARSTSNYPAFLAGLLGATSYTDVSCSAALTSDLYRSQTTFDGARIAPQLDALSASTDLVTLGIGGNDFGIYTGLLACQEAAQATPCPVERLSTDAERVQDHISQAVRRIKQRAPEAQVYVVGYPDILPTEGTCAAVGVPADALQPVTRIAGLLNASLRRGAEAAGASYVDLAAISQGHDVCAKGRAWVNGPRFRAGIAAPFHPKINGMRAVASELFREIAGRAPEMTEYPEPDPSAIVRNNG